MSEPIEMSKARNVYSKQRDRFRRELQWALRQYEDRPLSFDIKQHLRFIAADLKEDCMNSYKHETKNICSNQDPLIGTSLRIRSMASSETPLSSLSRNKSPNLGSRMKEDDDDIDEWISRNRASGLTGRTFGSTRGEPSVPLSKMTYNAHRSASANTHVLSFEKQLKADIDQMIDSIDYLDDKNRANWLTIPGRMQYFSSRYDTNFSEHPITTPMKPLFNTSTRSTLNSTSRSTTESTAENGLANSEARSYFDRYLKKY